MTAPPVLLVHGLATSAQRTWGDNGWLDLLADTGRSTIAPDLLGHGDAERPTDPEAYDRLEDLLAATLPDEPVDAIGFSLGARCLLVLAGRQPDRFRRLVLAGVGANLFRHDDVTPLADVFDGSGDVPPWASYFVRQAEASGNDAAALAALLRRPHPPAVDMAALAGITCPTLVVLGSDDWVGPADPLVDALPDATLQVLPGVDHAATPKAFGFLDAALDFLAVDGS